MKKVYAGLPLWAWLGVAGAGGLAVLWLRRRPGAPVPAAGQTPTSYAPPTGLYQLAPIYLGGQNPYTATASSSSTTPAPSITPTPASTLVWQSSPTVTGNVLAQNAHPVPFTFGPSSIPLSDISFGSN